MNLAARSEPFDFAVEPFDAAIHFGAPHWAGAACDYLMREEVVPVCSPAYKKRHSIDALEALSKVVLLQQNTRQRSGRTGSSRWAWRRRMRCVGRGSSSFR